MTEVAPVIRPRAQLVRVHDGDTYLLLLDLHARGLSQDGCQSVWVRLRGYSARELSDTAAEDPKGLGRVDGPAARDAAQAAFAAATEILVEIQGPAGASSISFDRLAATIYVDGQDLGVLLEAQHAVAAGAFEGVIRLDHQA